MDEMVFYDNDLISIKTDRVRIFLYKNIINYLGRNHNWYMCVSFREFNFDQIKFNSEVIDHFKNDGYLIKLSKDYILGINDAEFGFDEFQFWSLIIIDQLLTVAQLKQVFDLKAEKIINLYKAFVFYKGLESNVIWIAKNKELEFPIAGHSLLN